MLTETKMTVGVKKDSVSNNVFMWLFLLLLPPVGIYIMWKKTRFTIRKRVILSAVFTIYFLSPFLIGASDSIPLYENHAEFKSDFLKRASEFKLPYQLEESEKTTAAVTYKMGKNITLIENVDTDQAIHEIVLVGHGKGKDIIMGMGLLIGATNPDLEAKQIGHILNELHLFDEGYDFRSEPAETEKEKIRYHLTYDKNKGLVFSISKA